MRATPCDTRGWGARDKILENENMLRGVQIALRGITFKNASSVFYVNKG